jgi:very-short-patch-repair endonuclease
MWFLIGATVVLIALFILLTILFPGRKYATEYEYRKKEYLLTQPERDCFNALLRTVGNEFHVFPQVHLDAILYYKIRGQSWFGAWRHINEKSIDFILCDKEKISVVLAIELDDRSHERPDRRERDHEVERILKNAQVPLLRLQHNFVEAELAVKAHEAISQKFNQDAS